jgi:dihydroorotate dehydrogenase electron transfer subunit
MNRNHRNTICIEDAEVLHHLTYPSNQFVLRLQAPECASKAIPGSFVHVRCDSDLPMRRPLSIMRINAEEGWIEVLYKTVGLGLKALSKHKPGDRVSILGPIGNGFQPNPDRPLVVMIGGGVGIPPLIFLGEHLCNYTWRDSSWHQLPRKAADTVAFFGSEIPFPFELQKSAITLDGCPASATATMDLMENCNIPCRLASAAGFAGCYPGMVTDLAREWLETLAARKLEEATIYACGPEPMLRATAKLARAFALPSQLCLEEFMACAVGGCAGCAVEVITDAGPAMKRVCVDGPVFRGEAIYPAD